MMNQVLFRRQSLTRNILFSEQHKFLRQLLLLLVGITALTISSKIEVLIDPVPQTMQTFVVLFIGMVYGWRLGTLTVASFLLIGLMGFPVFAWPVAGPTIFFGATGGYLMGFLPAAFLSGLLIEYGWGRSHLTSTLAALVGMAVIYFYGIFWLTKSVGFQSAVTVGLMPFVLFDLLKIFVLALIVPKFWKS